MGRDSNRMFSKILGGSREPKFTSRIQTTAGKTILMHRRSHTWQYSNSCMELVLEFKLQELLLHMSESTCVPSTCLLTLFWFCALCVCALQFVETHRHPWVPIYLQHIAFNTFNGDDDDESYIKDDKRPHRASLPNSGRAAPPLQSIYTTPTQIS